MKRERQLYGERPARLVHGTRLSLELWSGSEQRAGLARTYGSPHSRHGGRRAALT